MDSNPSLPYHRLFVLGAGFSKPAGLPLATRLLGLVREQVRREFRVHGWDGSLEQEIHEWSGLHPGEAVDLERVLGYSHMKHHLRLLGSKEYHEHGSRSIVAARRAIQQILINSTPRDTPHLYRKFAAELSPNDVVLTFNYDMLMEQTLDDIGKRYSLTPEWWLDRDPSRPGLEYVDLIKLHGSVDWYDRYYHDDAVRWHAEGGHGVPDKDPIFGPNPSVPLESLSRGRTRGYGKHILPRVFRVRDHHKYFPLDTEAFSRVVPYLLPLAYDKLLGYDAILDLWQNLHRTDDMFSSIVVIGYSMPQHDSHAFETLGQLFVDYQAGEPQTWFGQRRVPIQVITLADSKTCALENIPFLDSAKTRVWDQGFSEEALNWIDWGDGARAAG